MTSGRLGAQPRLHSNRRAAAARGCGFAGVVFAAAVVVGSIAIVAWLIAIFNTPQEQKRLEPVDTSMPPPVAAPPPLVDVHAPGRTADQLFDWSQPIGNATNVSGQAIRAYANAALIAQEAWPECPYRGTPSPASVGWKRATARTPGASKAPGSMSGATRSRQ